MSDELILQVITSVITSASVTTILSGASLWLAKSMISERIKDSIKNEYDQKLETHKAQLKAHSDTEIEKLRSQLSILATEHEVRFSRLHEKRAEVIRKTYALLKELYYRLGAYVSIFEPAGFAPKEKRGDETVQALKGFHDYYATRLIFFPKIIANKLVDIDNNIIKTYNDFAISIEMSQGAGRDAREKWMQIYDRYGNEIKTALEELENEFRKLLGDES